MMEMNVPALLLTSPGGAPAKAAPAGAKDDPEKAKDAARQFEALLLGQILRSVRGSGSGWLGSGEDSAGDCATDLAEQQLARLLAEQGGLGLASLIAAGLDTKPKSPVEPG